MSTPSIDPQPNDAPPGVPAPPPGFSVPSPSAYTTRPGYGQPGYGQPGYAPTGYVAPNPAPGYGGGQAQPAYAAAWTPAPPPGKPPVKAWDVALTVILLIGDLGIAAVASFMAVFLVMASDPCGVRACSTELITLGWLLGMGLPWLVLIVVATISIVRLVRRRLAFWVPLVGAAAIVLSLVLAFSITAAGVPTG